MNYSLQDQAGQWSLQLSDLEYVIPLKYQFLREYDEELIVRITSPRSSTCATTSTTTSITSRSSGNRSAGHEKRETGWSLSRQPTVRSSSKAESLSTTRAATLLPTQGEKREREGLVLLAR